jgi:DNA-binding transcriptional regulator YiaG
MEMVEAIDNGRIVRVSEEYAKMEGLPILRRSNVENNEKKPVSEGDLVKRREFSGRGIFESSKNTRGLLAFEEYRRPLKRSESDVSNELVDNFHWEILKRRKEKEISRKQFASDLHVSEDEVKMVENGRLPRNDFVLINKIQSYLGINLRKDGQDFSRPVREKVENSLTASSSDIEIIE